LLDDPEVRVLVFGLAHLGPASPSIGSGAPCLRAVVLHLADTTDLEQYRSWLSDDAPNTAMTVDEVRATIGDGAISDLAAFVSGSPSAVAWQLAAVLPDLVDAVSPGGRVIDADRLAQELADASAYDDLSAGPSVPVRSDHSGPTATGKYRIHHDRPCPRNRGAGIRHAETSSVPLRTQPWRRALTLYPSGPAAEHFS